MARAAFFCCVPQLPARGPWCGVHSPRATKAPALGGLPGATPGWHRPGGADSTGGRPELPGVGIDLFCMLGMPDFSDLTPRLGLLAGGGPPAPVTPRAVHHARALATGDASARHRQQANADCMAADFGVPRIPGGPVHPPRTTHPPVAAGRCRGRVERRPSPQCTSHPPASSMVSVVSVVPSVILWLMFFSLTASMGGRYTPAHHAMWMVPPQSQPVHGQRHCDRPRLGRLSQGVGPHPLLSDPA